MKDIEIFCKNTGIYVPVEGGSTLADLAGSIGDRLPVERPICAKVNNKTEGLSFRIFAPKMVEFIDSSTPSGSRVYIRSLCMMLYRAVCRVLPHYSLCIEHSVSRGYFCRLTSRHDDRNPFCPDPEIVAEILAEMEDLHRRDLPFEQKEMLTSDVLEIFRRQGLDSKVLLLETTRELYTSFYTLDGISDSYYGPLAPTTGYIGVFNLTPFKDGMLLLGPDPENPREPARPVKQEKMFHAFTEHLRFNRVIKVSDVGELNRSVQRRETSRLINLAEAMHDKLLGRIADEIVGRHREGSGRVVLIAGPSSSGKTTSSKRLAIQLMTSLMTPKLISLDDYFVDREQTPLDADGDYDYESIHALDLPRLNSDLKKLLNGETINLPTYSFELGRRIHKERPLTLGKDDVLLIEGIHGLNPELCSEIDPGQIFKVYVSALTTLHIDDHNWISTTDTRLLRRIVRDHKYRNTSALETIRRWPSVRRGEEKWIFPFQENADATFNSSLLFELGVMKGYAEPLLRDVPHDCEQYSEAYRLLRFLSYFSSIPSDQIPKTSLLREFLGGSSFRY